ncbi:hypothetical protein PspLS_11104 [Pyricularia sp. CBS 133598]|nr:hypothetical protein PspLS_11104 [Pyricularia sp. CBS 133598]
MKLSTVILPLALGLFSNTATAAPIGYNPFSRPKWTNLKIKNDKGESEGSMSIVKGKDGTIVPGATEYDPNTDYYQWIHEENGKIKGAPSGWTFRRDWREDLSVIVSDPRQQKWGDGYTGAYEDEIVGPAGEIVQHSDEGDGGL